MGKFKLSTSTFEAKKPSASLERIIDNRRGYIELADLEYIYR